MILCKTVRVEMFNYFWLDLKSWEVRKQYVSTLVDRIPIKQKSAQSNSRRTCTYSYNLQCSRVKYQVCAKMFADTFGVSSRTIGDWIPTSIGDNSPTTTITPEAVLSATTTITPETVHIKAKPTKVHVPQECKEFLT